jgi:hypothetical protein
MYAENVNWAWTQVRVKNDTLTLLSQGIQNVASGTIPMYSLTIQRNGTSPAPVPAPDPNPEPIPIPTPNNDTNPSQPNSLYATLEISGGVLLVIVIAASIVCIIRA